MNLITPYKVSSDLKINVSCARAGIRYLASKGLIKPVATHAKIGIYVPAAKKK